jgi:hypothetical protein
MSDVVIRVRAEAAELKAGMDDAANAVRDRCARMAESFGDLAANTASHADAVAGGLDKVAETAAYAAAGFAAMGQVQVSAPLVELAAGAETAATAVRTLGAGAETAAGLFGDGSAAARDHADASREVAAASQEAGISWVTLAVGGAALAAAGYAHVQVMLQMREAVATAAGAVADGAAAVAAWAGEITGATATTALFGEQAAAQADAAARLALQYGEQAQAFAHAADFARDYGVAAEESNVVLARMVAVLDPANKQFQQQRDILRAYGVDSKDAAAAADQFARALSGVRDGAAKTADAVAVLGASAPKMLRGIADGAGEISHAFSEADRVAGVTMANIQASNQRIASGPHLSWLGQMGDQWREVSGRAAEYVTRTDEFKAKQEYALSHAATAWREYRADVASLGSVWDAIKQSASEYFTLVMHGSKGLAVPERPKDDRPDAPTRRPTEAAPLSRAETESGASADIAAFQKALEAKKLAKENWFRQDHALDVQHWQNAIAEARNAEVQEGEVLMVLLRERLAQAERAEAQYQQGRAVQAEREAEKMAEAEKSAQLRGLEVMTQAARKGSMERVLAAGEEVSYAFNTWGAMSSQYKATMDRLMTADREYHAEQREIAKTRLDADQEVAALGLAMEKDRLEAEVDAGQISAVTKITALRTLTATAHTESLARLDTEISSLDKGTKEWEHAMARRRVLVAKQAEESEKLAIQQVAAERKAGQEWMSAFAPAGRAMDAMVQGVMQGNQTISQVVSRAAANMAVSYVSAFATMAIQFAAFRIMQSLGWTQMAGGMLDSIRKGTFGWLLGEQSKTAATAAGNATRTASTAAATATQTASATGGQAAQTAATAAGAAARNAAGATEQAGFFSRIATQIAQWLGFETAKTVATTAEVATRETEEVSATIAAIAAAKAQALGEIPAYTGIAAMAAASAVAGIPIVGPKMALAAAAEMEALGAAELALATAAGGADSVAFDGQMFQLHKEEMVLSARYANPLRAWLENVPASGGYAMPALGLGAANDNPGGGGFAPPNAAAVQPLTINAPLTVNAGGTSMGPAEFRAALDQHAHHVARAVEKGKRAFARDRR